MRNYGTDIEQTIRGSRTWVELMQRRAEHTGERSAYTFLRDGEPEVLCYRDLDASSRALAALMREGDAQSGARALLLVPAGTEFVRAFIACLYAGMIAVPVPLPSSKRGLPRVLGIVRDCRPSVVVSTQSYIDQLYAQRDQPGLAELTALRWVALEAEQDPSRYRATQLEGSSVAFLQYTSGSTGTPKGVVITHENLLANQRAIASAFAHDAQSTVVGWLPPFHDMGLIGNVLQPMFLGIEGVHMTPQYFLADPLRWLRAISRFRATTSGGPNFAYELCAQQVTPAQRAELDLSSWKVAFNGAEPVRASTMERFAQAFAEAGFCSRAFYPCYGLAEATLLVSGGAVDAEPSVRAVDASALEAGRILRADGAERKLVGCGSARESTIAIVQPETRVRCGAGEVGEVWLAGASVAQGYWQRHDENEHTFAARTADGEGPFLRTGDLGALIDDELFITGRLKDLIIVRGRNLYPQDLEQASIESSLATRSGAAAAFAMEGDAGVVVVQEVRARGELAELARSIRSAIAERFQIALHAVVLIAPGTLPRTTSGKVQRRATRARFVEGTLAVKWSDQGVASDGPAEAPRDECERELAAIWEAVLAREPGSIGRERAFVELGGDSLQATQIAARVADTFACAITGAQLFETPTVAELAAWVKAQPPAARAEGASLSRVPLSAAQERIWFSEQLVAGQPVYHVAGAVHLRGELDREALAWAVDALVERHPTLRSRFVLDRDGVQQRVLAAQPGSLQTAEAQGRALADVASALIQRPFALSEESPARFLLVRMESDVHALVFVAHHIVVDGWSTGRLVRDLAVLYRARRGRGPMPPPVVGRYSDYAAAARCVPTSVIDYWRARFSVPPAPLELPTDRARGALQSHRGARHLEVLPEALTAYCRTLGRAHGVTPFIVFCAAYAALLARLSGQREVCLGTPMMARESACDEDVVGCYLDTLPLRIDLSDAPNLIVLLSRVQATLLGAQRNRALPFQRLLEVVGGARDLARTPLFQAMITMLPPQQLAGDDDWRVEQLDTGTAQLELALDIVPQRDGRLSLVFEYDRALFDAVTIARWSRDYLSLLARWAHQPELKITALPWLSGEELGALPVAGRLDAEPVHLQFERIALRMPEREAVVGEGLRISYGELDARANQLAHVLLEEGLEPDRPVAVWLARGPELLIALLAILKAGGGYLLLDPEQPAERTRAMLVDAGISLVVAAHALSEPRTLSLSDPRIARAATCRPSRGVHGQQLAYLLYTSGSTGHPKGVAVSHAALANTLAGWRAAYGEALHAPRVLSLASAAFDVFSADWVRALCCAGTLVLGEASLALDPRGIFAKLRGERISLVDLVPAQVEALLPSWPGEALALRAVIVGSDVWSLRTMRALRAVLPASCRLLSCYGVTEAAIDSAYFEHPPADGERAVPLGAAFAGCALYVLDAAWQVLPEGVPGELAIAGGGLARGYLNRPALTADRFVPDPRTPGGRVYRTGDRVRRDGGTLSFLGRLDAQVKVRGVRVELGEIEACLCAQPSVRAACVASRDGMLVAYLVLDGPLDQRALRAALRERLPDALQPSAYVQLDALPLSANGKLDRRALPAVTRERLERATAVAPRSALEQQLVAIWRELLPGREVGVHDNFFDLGGHSLLLAQVQSRLLAQHAREVSVLTMLQHPTIEGLAAALEGQAVVEGPSVAQSNSVRGASERRAELLARRRGGRQ